MQICMMSTLFLSAQTLSTFSSANVSGLLIRQRTELKTLKTFILSSVGRCASIWMLLNSLYSLHTWPVEQSSSWRLCMWMVWLSYLWRWKEVSGISELSNASFICGWPSVCFHSQKRSCVPGGLNTLTCFRSRLSLDKVQDYWLIRSVCAEYNYFPGICCILAANQGYHWRL